MMSFQTQNPALLGGASITVQLDGENNQSDSQKSHALQGQSRYLKMVDALHLARDPSERELRSKLLLARDVCTAQSARLAAEQFSLDLLGVYRIGALVAGEAAFCSDASKLQTSLECVRLGYQFGQAIERLELAI